MSEKRRPRRGFDIERATRAWARLPVEERLRLLRLLSPFDALRWDATFDAWVHAAQKEPEDEGWRTWLMLAGRGFGKTRAGAEWITALAVQRKRPVRIALVGATIDEARKVMVEGESGLLAVGKGQRAPKWEPSLGRLTWRGGSIAELFSGENPDGLRGPQHHYAWCDELAKWGRPEDSWANLQLGLRAGTRPRALVTTTPRPIPLLRRLSVDSNYTIVSRGRTDHNITLPESFHAAMADAYGGTRLGRQELDGELIEDLEGALWTRELIEKCRARAPEELRRVVVGVDPPASASGDACGIVACGTGADGIGYVLGDHSVRGLAPEGWARAVVRAAEIWEAGRVVVETNQGGEMVESVLRSADCALPVAPVKARFGKGQRAEPVSMLFARGRARLAGTFPELEDEMCGLLAGGGYEGPGRSPDRADAMVWAMAELLCAKPRAEPRVRVL